MRTRIYYMSKYNIYLMYPSNAIFLLKIDEEKKPETQNVYVPK